MLSDERGEGGFTLVELLVTMTIFLLVSGSLLSALESGMRTERRTSQRIDDEQALRLTLAQLTHDVRSADSLVPTDRATLADELDLVINGQHIQWRYDPTGAQLVRAVVTDTTVSQGATLAGVVNGAAPMFSLLGTGGQDLGAAPGMTGADEFRCAAAVRASVMSGAHPVVPPFTETAVAELHAPIDRQGCP